MLVLFITSLPVNLERGAGFPGLMVALVIIGLGLVGSCTCTIRSEEADVPCAELSAGGIKSNVGPLVAKQYVNKKPRVSTGSNGLRVIVDPDVTIQTIFSRYYWYGHNSGAIVYMCRKLTAIEDHEYRILRGLDRNRKAPSACCICEPER